ncbi:MAG: DUF4860 domain-containing protein [Clostridia bacterium]|nr:DUF4860 domain-containing protein [Clostridia bacterium]
MRNKNELSVENLFAFLLLLIYVITVLFVILSGVGVYKKTVELGNNHFNSSTAIMYVRQKVRSADSKANLTEENFRGRRCLVIENNENGKTYKNFIFFEKGYLCEFYISENSNLEDVFPTKIVPIKSFDFEIENNLLKLNAKDEDEQESNLILYLYGGESR